MRVARQRKSRARVARAGRADAKLMQTASEPSDMATPLTHWISGVYFVAGAGFEPATFRL